MNDLTQANLPWVLMMATLLFFMGCSLIGRGFLRTVRLRRRINRRLREHRLRLYQVPAQQVPEWLKPVVFWVSEAKNGTKPELTALKGKR